MLDDSMMTCQKAYKHGFICGYRMRKREEDPEAYNEYLYDEDCIVDER